LQRFAKPEGNEGTHNDEDFTITWKLNRTVNTDQSGWPTTKTCQPTAQKAFRWKAEVNLAYLRDHFPN